MARPGKVSVLAASALIAALALAGCTAHEPAARQSAAAQLGSAPSPTLHAEVVTLPTPGFHVPCAQLLDPGAIGYAGTAAPLEDPRVGGVDLGLGGALQASKLQEGALDCVWPAPAGATGGPTLTVSAVDGAQSRAASDIAGIRNDGGQTLGVGDDSSGQCFASAFNCYGEVLSGSLWLFVGFQGQPSGQTLTTQQGMAILKSAAAAAEPRLAESSSAAHGEPAQTTWAADADCSTLGGTAAIAAVIGPGGWEQGERPGDEDGPLTFAYNADYLACAWQPAATRADGTAPMFELSVVPGATWVWPYQQAAASVTSTPITVAGATQAAYRCAPQSELGTQCWGDALSGGAWLQLHFSYGTDDTQQNITATLAAVIAAHGTA